MNTWLRSIKLHVFGWLLPPTTFSSVRKFRPSSISFRCVDITKRCAFNFRMLNVFTVNGRGCVAYQFDGVSSVGVSNIASFVTGLSTFKSFKSISGSSCSRGLTTKEPSIITAGDGVTIQTDGCAIGASGGGEVRSLITISWMRHVVGGAAGLFWNDSTVSSTSFRLRRRGCGCGLLLALDDSVVDGTVSGWASLEVSEGVVDFLWKWRWRWRPSTVFSTFSLFSMAPLNATTAAGFSWTTLILSNFSVTQLVLSDERSTELLNFSSFTTGSPYSCFRSFSCRCRSMWPFKLGALSTWNMEKFKGILKNQASSFSPFDSDDKRRPQRDPTSGKYHKVHCHAFWGEQ